MRPHARLRGVCGFFAPAVSINGLNDSRGYQVGNAAPAIYRFLTKPWDDEELRDQIAQAFRTSEGMNKEG